MYLFSLTFFGTGCLGCGLSRNLGEMIAARAICGLGGAFWELQQWVRLCREADTLGGGLISISQICVWDLLPERHRALYQAVNNLFYGVQRLFSREDAD